MIVRAVDENNDWNFGKGKSDYKFDIAALAQIIKTRLQEYLADCFWKETSGIDWWNLLGSKRYLDLRLALQTTILNTEGVNGLAELKFNIDENRNLTVQYTVSSVYGTISTEEVLSEVA